MADDEYDETRATARLLPNLEIEILHRRPRQGHEEQMLITIRAIPSFEAFSRALGGGQPAPVLDSNDAGRLVPLAAAAPLEADGG